jgi:hypothetical protein
MTTTGIRWHMMGSELEPTLMTISLVEDGRSNNDTCKASSSFWMLDDSSGT